MQSEAQSNTPLNALGEFGLIEYLTQNAKINQNSTIKSIGDDAAVVKHDQHTVVTTDLLVEGIHFDLMYTPLRHLGYKAVVVNLSDVYAMNATPRQITVSIAVSARFSVEQLHDFYEGIYMACNKYNVDLVGGDTTSSLTGLCISVTALGEAAKENIVYRRGAKVNDLICVSGNLGAAYIGLQVLEREKKVFQETKGAQPKLDGYSYVLERQLKPEARKDIVELLKELGVKPTSMIDISDGLSSELLHICKQSEVGCAVYQEKIPIDAETTTVADEMNIVPLTAALSGGEDYELLFTVPIADFEKVSTRKEFTVIGHITEAHAGSKLILNTGKDTDLVAQGWNAMR